MSVYLKHMAKHNLSLFFFVGILLNTGGECGHLSLCATPVIEVVQKRLGMSPVIQALPWWIYQETNLRDGICCESKVNTYLIQIKILPTPRKNKTTMCFS